VSKRKCLSQHLTVLTLAAALGIVPSLASAIEPANDDGLIFNQGFAAPELDVQASVVTLDAGSRSAAGLDAMQGFFARNSADWEIRWDQRSNLPNLVQGVGVPILPGRGNRLTNADLGVTGDIQLGNVEGQVRRFMALYP
jgi:trimeric autotransporter adhesin